MSVYAEIVSWSQKLPMWQRDALRRLVTAGSVADAGIAELTSMCLAEANGKPVTPTPVPLDSAHVPATGAVGPTVSLTEIAGNSSINALVDDQRLSFASDGLTVIYGDNGAGKSGFVRVLRQVCHARGRTDPVLPNVYGTSPGTPTASIGFNVDGQDARFAWTPGSSAPESLSRVAVFDTYAAAEFVERKNEILWTPGGLDILERLVSVVDAVRDRLGALERTNGTPRPLPQVPGNTTAAQFLQGLSATTPSTDVAAFALKQKEEVELEHLQSALASDDPAKAASQLRQRAQRIKALRGRVAALEAALGQQGLHDLQALRQAYVAALEAEKLLAQETFSNSAVPGVGQAAWRTLWNAAEAYAQAGATPDHVFPSAQKPGLCVLCQQPLSDEARERLERFHAFVRADIAQRRAQAASALKAKLDEFRRLRAQETTDATVIAEISDLDPENGPKLRTLLEQAQASKQAISTLAANSEAWQLPQQIPPGWPAWLDGLVSRLQGQAAALEQAAQPEQRAAQKLRRNELLARKVLVGGRQLVEAEIRRLKELAAIQKALGTCKTTAITRRAGELTRAYVSDRMMNLFAKEMKALRLDLTTSYAPARGKKGASFQQIVLNAASWAGRSAAPVQVLSEGERRAVALAAFLAELDTRGDHCAVVFDDPVSSLDHARRQVVAHRLAELATTRQVIVFTHDLVFLHMLKTEAKEQRVALVDREVRRAGSVAGYCRDKPPPKAMTVNALLGELKAHQQSCAARFRSGDLDGCKLELPFGYGILREAWERAVEELLFNKSVMRFDHRVQTLRLKKVHDISEKDIQQIEAGMTACSKWLPGHAQASAINEPLPQPQDFLDEIGRLETFVAGMRKRGRR